MAEWTWTVRTRGTTGVLGPYTSPEFLVSDAAAAGDSLAANGITTAAADITQPAVTLENVDNLSAGGLTTPAVVLGLPTAQDLAEQPPDAPTLVSPTGEAELDGTQAHTFSWTFSSPEAGDTQAGYVFRRRSSDGRFAQWWDGTQWFSTETLVASTEEFINFPAGHWFYLVVDSLDPPSGNILGTTEGELIGAFDSLRLDSVTFGGVEATDLAVKMPYRATFTIPAGTGTVDVVVTQEGQSKTLTQAYTYGTLSLTGAAPQIGTSNGGDIIEVEGLNFVPGITAAVNVGGNPATAVEVQNSSIFCTTPAGAVGPADIEVVQDTQSQTLVGGFEYVDQNDFWSHSFDTPTDQNNFSQRIGFSFQVGASDILVNTLGIIRPPATIENTENIRIHRVSDGALIAGATLLGAGNSWVDTKITPVTLVANETYVISHRETGGTLRATWRNPTGLTFDPGITLVEYLYGTDDNMPATVTTSAYIQPRFGYTR